MGQRKTLGTSLDPSLFIHPPLMFVFRLSLPTISSPFLLISLSSSKTLAMLNSKLGSLLMDMHLIARPASSLARSNGHCPAISSRTPPKASLSISTVITSSTSPAQFLPVRRCINKAPMARKSDSILQCSSWHSWSPKPVIFAIKWRSRRIFDGVKWQWIAGLGSATLRKPRPEQTSVAIRIRSCHRKVRFLLLENSMSRKLPLRMYSKTMHLGSEQKPTMATRWGCLISPRSLTWNMRCKLVNSSWDRIL